MTNAKPLPGYLVRRFQGWRATDYAENKAWYTRLSEDGQHPRAMVISCCDSRVHVTSIFGADTGEFFIHRNIANLVPPYAPDDDHHGTSAAIEFAVKALKVAHIIVMGHSGCGGVKHFHDIQKGDAQPGSFEFVSNWINMLAPAWDNFTANGQSLSDLEKEGVLVSIDNLMGFPFVAEAVKAEQLSLHGLWHDIGAGQLECFEPSENRFVPLG